MTDFSFCSYVDARLHPEAVTHQYSHHNGHSLGLNGSASSSSNGSPSSLDVVEERPCDMAECPCMPLQKRARCDKKF